MTATSNELTAPSRGLVAAHRHSMPRNEFFAGVYLIANSGRDRMRTLDFVVALGFFVLVALPIYAMSWVAVTGLSFYILFFANDGAERRRGALVLLALAVPMLWSRLVFQFIARPLLELDAA